MFKKIERQLKLFTEGTGLADRCEIVHGTLYVKLKDDKNCDFFHTELRGFYRQFISQDGGVNMYAVGDEFAFDFVPEDREAPVFSDEQYSGKENMMPDDMDYGVWAEFAEEGLRADAEVDVAINLEAESKRGK